MNARITPRVRDEYFRGGGGGRESPNNLSVGSYGKNYREIWGEGRRRGWTATSDCRQGVGN